MKKLHRKYVETKRKRKPPLEKRGVFEQRLLEERLDGRHAYNDATLVTNNAVQKKSRGLLTSVPLRRQSPRLGLEAPSGLELDCFTDLGSHFGTMLGAREPQKTGTSSVQIKNQGFQDFPAGIKQHSKTTPTFQRI